jgi:hypothetical protein
MASRNKSGNHRSFNRLSANIKSVIIFSTAFVLICLIAMWV